MYRTQKLVIRLSDSESVAIEKMAEREKLPASTLARQLLLKEADKSNNQAVSQ